LRPERQIIIFKFEKTADRFQPAIGGIEKMEQIDFMKTEKVGQRIRTFMAKQELSLEDTGPADRP
jgi:hypothetical protein